MSDTRPPRGSREIPPASDFELKLTVETPEMGKDGRFRAVKEYLKKILGQKKVPRFEHVPDRELEGFWNIKETAGYNYSQGVPTDIPLDDFTDIVLFCSLLTENEMILKFKEEMREEFSSLEDDCEFLRGKIKEEIIHHNKKLNTVWLNRGNFLHKDHATVYVSLPSISDTWGFNAEPGEMIELNINQQEEVAQRMAYKPVISKYYFNIFFDEMVRMFGRTNAEKKFKEMVIEMYEAGLGFNKIEREDETEQISEPEPINLGQSPSFYEQEDDDLELSSVATGEHHTNKEDRGNSWWKTKEVIAEYEKKLLGD